MSSAAVEPLENLERFVSPMVVLRRRHHARLLTAFEQYVFEHIDGVRSVHEIRFALHLSEADMHIAVGQLAEKQAVELAGSSTAAAASNGCSG
jgi:hypothetical protein